MISVLKCFEFGRNAIGLKCDICWDFFFLVKQSVSDSEFSFLRFETDLLVVFNET